MPKPQEILERILARALGDPSKPAVTHPKILARIEYVSRCLNNRAGARLLMACMLAKLDRPKIDPRKPYTGREFLAHLMKMGWSRDRIG